MQQQQQQQQQSSNSRRGSTFATPTTNTATSTLANSSSSSNVLLNGVPNSSNSRARSGNRRFAITSALSRLVTESSLKQQEQKLAKLKVDYSAELDSISKAIALKEITTAESALLDLKLKDSSSALSPKGVYRKAQLHEQQQQQQQQQNSSNASGSAQATTASSTSTTGAIDAKLGATEYLEEWLRGESQSIKQIGIGVRTHEKEAQQRQLQEAKQKKLQSVEQVSSQTSTPRSANRSAKHRATTIVTSSTAANSAGNGDVSNGSLKQLLPTPPEVLYYNSYYYVLPMLCICYTLCL
jgi:hypothetical protein